MDNKNIWEIIGKISVIVTIIAAFLGIIGFFISNSNKYKIDANYRVYDYFIDNETVSTIGSMENLQDKEVINKYFTEKSEEYEITVNKQTQKNIVDLFYWYIKQNWNYSYEKDRVNDQEKGIYIIDITNNSNVALKNAYLNTNMDDSYAFIKYWDGSYVRTNFTNTLQLKEIKAKDKITVIIWKKYGAYPRDINLVFDDGTIVVNRYSEASSRNKDLLQNSLLIILLLVQVVFLFYNMYSKKKKT